MDWCQYTGLLKITCGSLTSGILSEVKAQPPLVGYRISTSNFLEWCGSSVHCEFTDSPPIKCIGWYTGLHEVISLTAGIQTSFSPISSHCFYFIYIPAYAINIVNHSLIRSFILPQDELYNLRKIMVEILAFLKSMKTCYGARISPNISNLFTLFHFQIWVIVWFKFWELCFNI